MIFCLNRVMSSRGNRTICSHGGYLAALPDRKIFRIGLYASISTCPRRLSINHMNEKWWLNFAGLATKQRIDSVGPTAANVATFFLSLCRGYGLVPQALKDGVSELSLTC